MQRQFARDPSREMEAATQLEETQLEDLDIAMATQLDSDVASQDSLPFLEPCLSASQSSFRDAAKLESNFPRDAPWRRSTQREVEKPRGSSKTPKYDARTEEPCIASLMLPKDHAPNQLALARFRV